MGLYDRYVLPKLIHLACGSRPHMRQREKVVPRCSGRVLEIGVGSGLNFPYYDLDRIERVWGLEPSAGMRPLGARAAARAGVEVEFIDLPGEEIPLEDAVVDTVLTTYTLCSIHDLDAALGQMRRVLRPEGRLVFCEHGAAPDASVRRWQNRIEPIWKKLSGGCHLSREIPGLIERGGFKLEDVETMYLPGWRPGTFNYWGSARPV